MGYYVDKKQFEDKDFKRTLEYYKAIGIEMDDEITAVYNANIETATGNFSNLYQVEHELESSEENIERYQDGIRDATERLRETNREIRKAKKERWEASIGSKEEAAANERVKHNKKHKAQAKKMLAQRKEQYRKYLVRLEDANGRKKELDEIQESCKKENEAIVAETQGQIALVTEFKTKLPLLESRIDNNVKFKIGNQEVFAGTVLNNLKTFNDNLKVSLATPLTPTSPELTMLHLLEEHAIKQEHQTEYPEKLSEAQSKIENGCKAYLDKNNAYNKYLNISSRGETGKSKRDDNDGR